MSKVLIAISGNLDRQLVARLLEDEDIAYYEVTDQVLEEKFLNSAGLIIVDTIHARKYAQLISKTKNSTNYFLPVIILLPPFEKAENWLTGVFDDIIRIPTSRRELKTRLLMYLKLHEQSVQIYLSSEQKYRTIFESTGTATILVAEDTTIVMANSNVYKLIGYKPEELIGTSWTKYASPKDLEIMLQYHKLRRVDSEAVPRNYEVGVIDKSGNEHRAILTATMMPNSKDSIISLIDITELKKAQQKALESDERLRLAFNTTPDAITISRLSDGLYVEVNAGFEKISGFTREEAVNRTALELNIWVNATDRENFLNVLKEQRQISNYECYFRRKNGEIFPSLISSSIVYINGIEHIITIARDMSEVKEAQHQIRILSSAIEQNPVASVIIDINGKIVFVNKHFIDITGYTLGDLGNDIHILFRKNDFTEHSMEKILDLVGKKEKWNSELKVERLDGTIFWASVNLSAIFSPHGEVSHYLITIEDITEKKQILQDLVSAKEKAEESDRLKTAFLHNISHEIRTPMNAIMGFSEFLIDPDLPENKRKKFVDIILRSGNQLLSIINDIISISLIESGQEKLYEAETNLAEVLRLVYNQYLPQAEYAQLDLRCDPVLCEKDLYIITDKTKLTQILSNLVSNALKFTHEGYVEMGYKVEGKDILFYVKDTGIGIPLQAQSEIFKRFRQVHQTNGKIYGGSGLGLSISKAYIDLMGGKIWVESEEGKGSRFYFTIPNKQSSVSDERIMLFDDNLIQLVRRKRILIAEDEDSNFALLEEYLSGLDIEIIRALDGEEVVNFSEQYQPIDVILMDIKMPRKDGIEATKIIKKKYPLLPIIAQTAYALDEDKDKILKSGFDDYLSKPLSREKLMQAIRVYLEK